MPVSFTHYWFSSPSSYLQNLLLFLGQSVAQLYKPKVAFSIPDCVIGIFVPVSTASNKMSKS
jgi:hypothetical protein